MFLKALCFLAICAPTLLNADPVHSGVLSSGHGVTVERTGAVSSGVHHGPLGAGHVVTNTQGTRVVKVGGSQVAGGIGVPLGGPVGVGSPLTGPGIIQPGLVGKPGLVGHGVGPIHHVGGPIHHVGGPIHPIGGLHHGAGALKTSSVQTTQQLHHVGAGGIGSPVGGIGGVGQTVSTKTISQQSGIASHSGIGSPLYG